MATTDPGKLLGAISAKVSRRRVLLTVIGIRMRDPESGRTVVMPECQPIATWCTSPGFCAPSPEEIAQVLAYWPPPTHRTRSSGSRARPYH